jgi:hypothetical protein
MEKPSTLLQGGLGFPWSFNGGAFRDPITTKGSLA